MTLGDGILGAIAAAILGWFANSMLKVGRSDFKELAQRVTELEKEKTDYISRIEFERTMQRLTDFMREFRNEIKADIRQLTTKG
jgi:gas vesicle protein